MTDNQQPSSESRICRKCGRPKPLDDYPFLTGQKRKHSYRRHTCAECANTKKSARSKAYYAANKERIKKRTDAYRRAHPESYREDGKRRARRFREMVIQAYGGPVCACCGEANVSMLTLDHINGGGIKHRTEIAEQRGWKGKVSGVAFYRYLVENGFPPGYQVLCFNCNYSKHLLGVCAHKLREGSTVIPSGSRSKCSEARDNSKKS